MSQTKSTVILYDNSITVHFNPNARNRYMIEETQHSPVGVTTILSQLAKPGLALWPMYEALDWLKKNPEDYGGAEKAYLIKSDKGKDIGTQVHAWVEEFLGGRGVEEHTHQGVDMNQEVAKIGLVFQDWFFENEPKVLATEQIIYSKEFDYAGTFDALLEIDGKVVLADIKTTNVSRTAPLGIYPEYLLQLGGYSLAHHEENPKQPIDDLLVIRVGKDGVLNTLRASELGFTPQFLEDAFKAVVNTYKFVTPLSKQLKEMK